MQGLPRGRMLEWTLVSGSGLVQPLILGTQSCSMGVFVECGGAQSRREPTGTAWRGERGDHTRSTFAPADADHGGAGGALTPAGWAVAGGLFQLGDDLGKGLQIPLTLQGRDQEVN